MAEGRPLSNTVGTALDPLFSLRQSVRIAPGKIARAARSDETRHHLEDAHQRAMSVAAVQRHLHAFGAFDPIAGDADLMKFCAGLAASMVNESQPGMSPHSGGGLGAIIVQALVRSLDAHMEVASDTSGTAISIATSGSSANQPNIGVVALFPHPCAPVRGRTDHGQDGLRRGCAGRAPSILH